MAAVRFICTEEGGGSIGQNAGYQPVGVTRRQVQQRVDRHLRVRFRALARCGRPSGDAVRVKGCGKSAPAASVTGPAR